MGALASPSTWRQAPYSYDGYLWLDNPPVVYSARVNQASFTYPIYEVIFDTGSGTLANVKPGMLVLFGSSAGAADKGRSFVRKNPTSNTLYFGRSSRGIREGRVDLADNLYITILDTYLPHIAHEYTDATGQVFKSQDLDFATFGDVGDSPPCANAGIYYAAFVDEDDEITVDFDGSASFATEPGATISSYAWTFPGGTPSSSSSASPSNVVFGPGWRWISLTVTDSNGKSSTARALVVGLEKTGANAPLKCEADGSQTLGFDEHRMAFRVIESIPKSSYPEGTVAIYIEHERFGSSSGSIAGPSDRQHVKFVGYLGSINTKLEGTEKGLIKRTVISCYDVLSKIKQLSTRGGDLLHASVPSRWGEMDTPTIDRALWYLLYWHSTVPGIADFTNTGTGTAYSFPDESYPESSLLSQMQHFAQLIRHMVTCDDKGRIQVKPDPMLHDASGGNTTVARTTVTTVSIVESDIESIEVIEDQPPAVYGLLEKARVAGTTTSPILYSQAPGDALGSGESNESGGAEYLVVSQEELDAQTGHKYERANAPEGLYRIVLKKPGDAGIVPGNMEWIQVTLSAEYAAERGLTFTNARFLVHQRDIEHDHKNGVKQQILTAEREVTGTPGEPQYFPEAGETPPNAPDDPSYEDPGITPQVPTRDPYPGAPTNEPPITELPPENPDDEPPYNPFPPGGGGGGGGGNNNPSLPTNGNTVAYWGGAKLRVTKTFLQSASPNWLDVTPAELAEGFNVQDFVWSGFGRDGYCLATDGDDSNVYYGPDLGAATVAWAQGGTLEGGWSYLRTTGLRDKIYIFTSGEGWAHRFIFSQDTGDPDPDITYGNSWSLITNRGKFTSGVGYQIDTVEVGFGQAYQVEIRKSFDLTTLTEMEVKYSFTQGTSIGEPNDDTIIRIYDDDGTIIDSASKNSTTGSNQTFTWQGSEPTAEEAGVRIRPSFRLSGGAPADPGAATITEITLRGTGENPFNLGGGGSSATRYSEDKGDTFGSIRIIGVAADPSDGFDAVPRTQKALGSSKYQPKTADGGGGYSSYGSAYTLVYPTCIFVPRCKFGTTADDGTGADNSGNPEYLLGSKIDAGSVYLRKVTNNGTTITDITPSDGTNLGQVQSARALWMPWNSGNIIVGIFIFGSTRKLAISEDAGENWEIIRSLGADADCPRMPRASTRAIYWVDGDSVWYTPDLGETIYEKSTPDGLTLQGVYPYG